MKRAAKNGAIGLILVAFLSLIPNIAAAQTTPDEYRTIAEEILEQPAYSDEQPGLIARLRQWIDEQVDLPSSDAERPELDGLSTPAFELTRSAILLVVSVVLIVLGASFLIKHRSTLRSRMNSVNEPPEFASATELEQLAEKARAAGDWAGAIRYRFRAGLARLERKGVIHYSPTLTSGEISKSLGDDDFDTLAATFDAITYGDATAAETDENGARSTWPRVIDRAGSDAS